MHGMKRVATTGNEFSVKWHYNNDWMENLANGTLIF